MINLDVLLGVVSAGATIVAQESVKHATKQAYEALKEKLGNLLGESVLTTSTRSPTESSRLQVEQKLASASEEELRTINSILEKIVSDAAFTNALPGRVVTEIKGSNVGNLDISADGQREVIANVINSSAGDIRVSAKKNSHP